VNKKVLEPFFEEQQLIFHTAHNLLLQYKTLNEKQHQADPQSCEAKIYNQHNVMNRKLSVFDLPFDLVLLYHIYGRAFREQGLRLFSTADQFFHFSKASPEGIWNLFCTLDQFFHAKDPLFKKLQDNIGEMTPEVVHNNHNHINILHHAFVGDFHSKHQQAADAKAQRDKAKLNAKVNKSQHSGPHSTVNKLPNSPSTDTSSSRKPTNPTTNVKQPKAKPLSAKAKATRAGRLIDVLDCGVVDTVLSDSDSDYDDGDDADYDDDDDDHYNDYYDDEDDDLWYDQSGEFDDEDFDGWEDEDPTTAKIE
jgi:hypothetical protein